MFFEFFLKCALQLDEISLFILLGENFVNNPNLSVLVEGISFNSGKQEMKRVKPGMLIFDYFFEKSF